MKTIFFNVLLSLPVQFYIIPPGAAFGEVI